MNMKVQKMLATGSLGLMSMLVLAGCASSGQSQASNDTARIMSKEVISTADSSLATDIVSAQAITNTSVHRQLLIQWKDYIAITVRS